MEIWTERTQAAQQLVGKATWRGGTYPALLATRDSPGTSKREVLVGLGSRGPTKGAPQRGRHWGAHACSPCSGSLPYRPTPHLTASGTSAQVMVMTSQMHPTPPFSPLSQSSVCTAVIIALHGGNPSRLPVSAHEWLSPLAKHSRPVIVMSRSLTQFPFLPPLPSNRRAPPPLMCTFHIQSFLLASTHAVLSWE